MCTALKGTASLVRVTSTAIGDWEIPALKPYRTYACTCGQLETREHRTVEHPCSLGLPYIWVAILDFDIRRIRHLTLVTNRDMQWCTDGRAES